MTAPLYTLNFRLRAKNSAGTVQKTFMADAETVGTSIGFGAPEPVMDERTDGTTLADESYMLGYRNSWTVSFTIAEGTLLLAGETGYDSLEAVINAAGAAGATLEMSLDGGSSWIRVLFDGAPSPGKPGGFYNVGKTWELNLKARDLTATPCLTS